jgi:hypothetical protein
MAGGDLRQRRETAGRSALQDGLQLERTQLQISQCFGVEARQGIGRLCDERGELLARVLGRDLARGRERRLVYFSRLSTILSATALAGTL